jgi:hypothetical protein
LRNELTPEEGFRRLNELFGSNDASAPPTRGQIFPRIPRRRTCVPTC